MPPTFQTLALARHGPGGDLPAALSAHETPGRAPSYAGAGTRAGRRHAARELARQYGVPFRVAQRTVAAICAGKACPEFAARYPDLRPLSLFPPLVELEARVGVRI